MTKGQLIGKGRTADIYAWGDESVLKLYRLDRHADEVEHEAYIARAVHTLGANSPALLDVVEVEGRYGLVYRRVRGASLAVMLKSRPWLVSRLARRFAHLHASMHKRHTSGLPSQRDRLMRKIRGAVLLPDELQELVLQGLTRLPDGDILCHGDFHPENVIMSPRGLVAIDWVEATQGNPLADVARTLLILRAVPYSLPKTLDSIPARLFVTAFHTLYLRYYIAATGTSPKRIKAWLPAVAAARLGEDIAEEESYLLRVASN